MKTAQKIKVIMLLWVLPLSMLPHVNSTQGRPLSAAPTVSPRRADVLTASENYGKLPLSFEANARPGDWNGDGIDSVGVFDQNIGQMLLTNKASIKATADITFSFGQNGDIPLAGDWDGKPSLP